MKRYIISFIVLLLVANFLMAMNEGTTGAQFLKILVGGKATSMGGAFVALADDASALYYNPAGIVKLKKNAIILNYVKWPADIYYSFIGMVIPLGVNGAFGIHAAYLGMSDMDVTTIENPEGTGETFSSTDFYVGFSYAKFFTDKLSIGVTGKIIQEMIYDASSQMIAIDAGSCYYTGFNSLRIGMAIRNFGSDGEFHGGTVLMDQYDKWDDGQTPINVYYVTDPYPIPLNFNFGIAYDFLEGPTNFLTTVLEFQNPNDGTENVRFGMEYNYNKMIALRLGYIFNYDNWENKLDGKEFGDLTTDEKIENLTAGIGFNYDMDGVEVGIDYSYTGMGNLSDNFTNGHRVSLQIGF